VGKKTAVNKIIIEPKNPLVITPEEAEELAKAIRASYPKHKVRVESSGYTGYAVTLYEVLNIWLLTTIGKQIIEQITKLAIEWARQRFKKQGKYPSPKSITIYGPHEEVLISFVLKNATDDPEDRTKEHRETEEIARRYRVKPRFNKETIWRRLLRRIFRLGRR